MDVELFDGRVGSWRVLDVPEPLRPELTVSHWRPDAVVPSRCHPGHFVRPQVRQSGVWIHDVYRRALDGTYRFLGTAPDRPHVRGDERSLPGESTTLWPAPLQTAGLHRRRR